MDITEQPTGEYLALGRDEPVKAAFWLTHLETEVTRLHAKWQSIDAELKTREARIAALHEEIKARETTIAKLTADLQAEAVALKAADERLTGKDGEIAALVEDRRVRDERIAAISTELADAAVAHKATQENVARTQAETARLNDLLRREQAASAGTTERNEQLLAEQRALQAKLQDLEIYINGRHDRWSELNANLAGYKDALAGMEKTIKARDAIIAHHDEEKARLAASILDLERQCSELAGRRMEREEAHQELQQGLAAHLAQAEQLKAENAKRLKEAELVAKQAVDRQRHIESLERGIEHRDESVAALTAEVEHGKAAIGELTTARTQLDQRVDELDQGLSERSQQMQVLGEDLRVTHDQLRLVQDQVADRTTHLAASQEALDQKSRQSERLTDELHAAEKDAVQIRADIETLDAHATELGRLRGEAVVEAENLKLELASQHELAASLETELRSKQATADLLERSVGRITDLGVSLAALDEQTNIEAGRKLVVTIHGEAFDYPMLKKQMTIGRGRDSDIRIASHFVSRVHAKISTNGIATVIEDAGSKNGLCVNSKRVRRRVLRDGDVVCIGEELNMRFVDAAY